MEPSKFKIIKDVCCLEVYNKEGAVVNEAFIDTEDLLKVKDFRFHQSKPDKKRPYFRINNNRGERLHTLIMGPAPEGFVTDHINRITTDCRKKNLRFVTYSQNGMNRTRYTGKTSIYKGVSYDKSRKKWKAEIKLNQKNVFLCRDEDEKLCALQYNLKALELFGEYAVLNKIN